MACATSGTLSCHAGREDLTRLGVHAPPLDLSSTYPLHDLDSAEAAFEATSVGDQATGRADLRAAAQPDGRAFRASARAARGCGGGCRVRLGDGGDHRVPARGAGRPSHIVAIRPLYGGTDRAALHRVARDGHVLGAPRRNPPVAAAGDAACSAGDATEPDARARRHRRRGPTAADVPVLVDNTFATPVLQNPRER